MKKLEAVFFDLDGTLLDTLGDISKSYNLALEQLGLKTYDKADYRNFVGNGSYVLCQRLCGEKNSDKVEILNEIAQKIYKDNPADVSRVYDGIDLATKVLVDSGIKVCVLSNKPDAITQKIIKHYFPDGRFALVSGLKEGNVAKPDPEHLLNMCKKINVDAQNCIYVGDSDVDVDTARNAGMMSVACSWGFKDRCVLESKHPDVILDNTQDIARLLDIFENRKETK